MEPVTLPREFDGKYLTNPKQLYKGLHVWLVNFSTFWENPINKFKVNHIGLFSTTLESLSYSYYTDITYSEWNLSKKKTNRFICFEGSSAKDIRNYLSLYLSLID